MFYLTMHSTHFIYGYKASDIWKRTIKTAREETRCRHTPLYGDSGLYIYRHTHTHHPIDRIAHTTAFVTPVVKH